MPSTVPLLLVQASLTLYLTDAAGNALPGEIVWMGARAEGLRLSQEIQETESTGSGEQYPDFVQLSEVNEIALERIWVIRASDQRDYDLARGRYVMVILGQDRRTGLWLRRTYYGVRAKRYDLSSNGIMYFGSSQVFRAQYFRRDSGLGTPPPLNSAPDQFPVSFVRETAAAVGTYLMGIYEFPFATTVRLTRAVAHAGQGGDTVLQLEVDGVLSGERLTLPAGDIGEEVIDEMVSALPVTSGAALRWKVVSGPDPADSPSLVGVTMLLEPR